MYQNGFLNVQRQVSILRTICLAIAPRLKLTFPVSYLEELRGRKTRELLKRTDERGTRLEPHSLRDGLNGKVAIMLAVGHLTAGFFDSLLVKKRGKVHLTSFIDDLRDQLVA